jgi:hypothetical protein
MAPPKRIRKVLRELGGTFKLDNADTFNSAYYFIIIFIGLFILYYLHFQLVVKRKPN